MTHRRRLRPRSWRQRWTIQRATSAGLVFGLASVLTAMAFGSWEQPLFYPYAALVAATLLCGASILWITFIDMRARERGAQVRPIRIFDVVAGFVLALPAAYAMWRIWPALMVGNL